MQILLEERKIVMEDYEKLYKDVLAKAREIHRNENEKRSDMEWLFPELQESEDERIRKALIRFHKSTIDIDGIKGDRIVAWLEKQGEQKPFDYEHATITQKDFASVGETATIELSSPIDCGDRIYHVSHKPIEKNGEQKPTEWSEEDENYLQSAENACEYQYGKNTSTILWLKSLKDRIGG